MSRSDLYALGCSLYHLVTGRPPYRGKSFMQVLVAHREAPISSLHAERDDLPESLEWIYRRMVAKRPEERYQSAGELVADLEAFRDGTPGAAGPPSAGLVGAAETHPPGGACRSLRRWTRPRDRDGDFPRSSFARATRIPLFPTAR